MSPQCPVIDCRVRGAYETYSLQAEFYPVVIPYDWSIISGADIMFICPMCAGNPNTIITRTIQQGTTFSQILALLSEMLAECGSMSACFPPPPPDGPAIQLFTNNNAYGTAVCPNGIYYTVSVSRGTIWALSQAAADAEARALAYARARVGLNCTPITFSLATFTWCQNVGFSQTFTILGGTGPFNLAVTAGALPAGLALQQLSGNGRQWALTGTPTVLGISSVTLTALDTHNGNAKIQVMANKVLAITTATPLPDATVGVAYSQALAAAGGSGQYLWTITAGSLPAGLAIDQGGNITGTPTTSGTSNFTVSAQDVVAPTVTCTKAFALTASPAFSALAVNFNGTTTYLSRPDFIGNADGQQITFSFWFKLNGGNGKHAIFWSEGDAYCLRDFYSFYPTYKPISIKLHNSALSSLVVCASNSSYFSGPTWHHVLFSADLSVPVARLWIDDLNEYAETTLLAGTIDFTFLNHWIATFDDLTPYTRLEGCLAEFWRKHVYYDFNIAANRRLFDDGGTPLKPVEPPSGAIVYLTGNSVNFPNNSGSGGAFTAVALTDCSDIP